MQIEDMRDEKNMIWSMLRKAYYHYYAWICKPYIPQLKANASYYKMKLQVHNFTIYNVITHKTENYVCDETDGNLIASTFATVLVNHFKK